VEFLSKTIWGKGDGSVGRNLLLERFHGVFRRPGAIGRGSLEVAYLALLSILKSKEGGMRPYFITPGSLFPDNLRWCDLWGGNTGH